MSLLSKNTLCKALGPWIVCDPSKFYIFLTNHINPCKFARDIEHAVVGDVPSGRLFGANSKTVHGINLNTLGSVWSNSAEVDFKGAEWICS